MTTFFIGTSHLLKLLCLFTVVQQVRSWDITVPKTITAVEGSCVVVPCQTQPHYRVKWHEYHRTRYPVVFDGMHPETVEPKFRGRTSVLGKGPEGNCTLMINDVKAADNKLQVYVCINPEASPSQKFHEQTVTILVERKTPIISIQEQIVDGKVFQANCSVSHSCPSSPPHVQWIKSQFLENFTSESFNEKMQGQWLYTETLHGLATYEMHNSKIMCSAQFTSFNMASQEITLNILYKPVSVTLILEKEAVIEGGSIIMECAANCNPQPNTYSWLKREAGQSTVINSTQRRQSFNDIQRDTSFSCIAHNDIGEGQSSWLDLDVQYAPVVLPESSCYLTGEVVKCICLAEASPNASIYWTIDRNDSLPSSHTFVSTNKTNVVSGVMTGPVQSMSNISCTATNPLGSSTKQLSLDNLSETSSSFTWLIASILIALLFGCVMLIYIKYYKNRPPPGSVCNDTLLLRPQTVSDNVQQQQQQTDTSPERSQDEDTQLSPHRPESTPEMDRVSDVYDNDNLVAVMRQNRAQLHQSTKSTSCQKEVQGQPQAVDCNMGVYLNY